MFVPVLHVHHRELAVDRFVGDIAMEKVAVRVPEDDAGAAPPNRLQQGGLPSADLARPDVAGLAADRRASPGGVILEPSADHLPPVPMGTAGGSEAAAFSVVPGRVSPYVGVFFSPDLFSLSPP